MAGQELAARTFPAATVTAVLTTLAELGSATAAQIARHVHLQPRYVQAVLAAAEVTGRAVVVPRASGSRGGRTPLVYRIGDQP